MMECDRSVRRRLSPEDHRNNNVPDTGVTPDEEEPEGPGSLPLTEWYVEDNHLELTLLQQEYQDPSLGYEFVNRDTGWASHLDNSEALLRQLTDLGIRVHKDYITLDLDATTTSRTASLSTTSEDDSWQDAEAELEDHWREEATATAGGNPLTEASSHPTEDFGENEVVRAEILPSGVVKVSYDNLQKCYSPKISPQKNYHSYLRLVQGHEDEKTPGGETGSASCRDASARQEEHSSLKREVLLLKKRLVLSLAQLRRSPLSNIQAKCAARLKKLKGT